MDNSGKRFAFPEEIENALLNLDSIPCTEPNVVPGVPGRLFILAPSEKIILEDIINTLDRVTSDELELWLPEEIHYYSSLLHNADRVLRNSICR